MLSRCLPSSSLPICGCRLAVRLWFLTLGTYPDALLDEVVFVSLQLHFETVRLSSVGFIDFIDPSRVEEGIGFVGGRDTQTFDRLAVSLNVTTLFRLGNGSFQCISTQDDRTSADEKKTIESCTAWNEVREGTWSR